MPVSRVMTDAPLGREVSAKVFFELNDHAAQMKVTMVDGNSTASVVAYCCAALNDRMKLNLISSRYMLRVKNDLAPDHHPSGYLYGLCDVLTHPDVALVLSRGDELQLELTTLPKEHPEGMYVAMQSTKSIGRSPGAIRPPVSPVRYDEITRLEQAFGEETEREMTRIGYSTRRGLIIDQLGQSLRGADEMAHERIMLARENMRKAAIPLPPGEKQYTSTDTQTVEIVETPQMLPRAPVSVPSHAVEMLKKELQSAEENLRLVKEKLQATVERAEIAEVGLEEQQAATARYAELLGVEKGKVGRMGVLEKENEGLRDEVDRLMKENARLKKLGQTAQAREKELLTEIASLQSELTAETGSSLTIPPLPPPQPIHITNISASIPRNSRRANSGSTSPQRYQRITRDVEVIRSPGTPDVRIDPGDSLGQIVAKFTGKDDLGKAVDNSLRMPALEESDDEEGDDALLSQVAEIKKKLPLLASPNVHPSLRAELLREVEAIRHKIPSGASFPTTAFPSLPGPGSPGGPRSRSSTASVRGPLYHEHPSFPPPSSVASNYSATRPPGL
eukprot:TRINITY_DN22764_c0_g1_i1.p1 TRINITY_DN22764_c0_g1~~TRINITY_DN22764_c0_g1_i1.p1  ORF type:complete len:616 (+),score=103.56 TRINITY_DN22764_c0_g1_i1:164-1849(+)